MRAARRFVTLTDWRPRASGVAFLTAVALAASTTGCLSNEYRIDKNELRRLASLAPEARGQGVRVSQTLGDRRSDAVEPAIPEPPAPVSTGDGDVSLNGNFGGGGGSCRPPAGGSGSPARGFEGVQPATWRGTPPASPSGGGFHGTPPSGFHGAASGAVHAGGGYHIPASTGGALNFSGGGKDALVILAVVAIVAATAATIGLAASEGTRFEGHAEMAPEQLVYLESDHGKRAVALVELTPDDVATADRALVMDDEGYGLRRLDHAPLDRRGGVFRFDLGAGVFTLGDAHASGVSAHIQAGYFFTRELGLLFDLGLGAGGVDPCCAGALAPGGTLTRHSLGLELDALPLALGPLHLGAFAGGGLAITGAGGEYEDGPIADAGALFELDLTSHMALALRGGASRAWLPSGPSSGGTITGGLTIY